jgi:hypothetical protein
MSMDDQQFRKFVDELKDKADLVEVIQMVTPEYRFTKRGKWWTCHKPDSLQVDANWQQYTWFAKPGTGGHQFETGDVFDWLTRYGGMADFWAACQWLADRLGVQMPRNLGEKSEEQIRADKRRHEVYSVAHAWFMERLRGTAAALDYCRRAAEGRAFDDETICSQATAAQVLDPATTWTWREETLEKARSIPEGERERSIVIRGAGLGFSGGTPEAAEDLRKTFGMYDIDPEAPEAVALCGLRKGAKAWCQKHQVEAQENWLERGRIWGMVDFPRLVYAHITQGKVRYFTGRGLAWEKKRLIGDPDKAHKSWNPPMVLSGERQRYFNWLFNRRAESVVIVEGQADAIALGELGFAALALCGLAADQGLAEVLKEVKHKYIALDADQYGRAARVSVGQIFGPMARLVRWEEDEAEVLEGQAEVRGELFEESQEKDPVEGDQVSRSSISTSDGETRRLLKMTDEDLLNLSIKEEIGEKIADVEIKEGNMEAAADV